MEAAVGLAVVAFTAGAAAAGAPVTADVVAEDICLLPGCFVTDCSCGEVDLIFVLSVDAFGSPTALLAPHLPKETKEKERIRRDV